MELLLPFPEGENPGYLTTLCRIEVPLYSSGIWGWGDARDFLSNSLPRLQLQLALIFLLTQSFHALLRRFFNSPQIIAQMLAGFVLGPTLLGKQSETLFPREGEVFINLLGKLGYIFFTFLIGVKIDPSIILRTGSKAWIIALGSLLVSLTIALLSSAFLVDSVIDTYYRRPSIKFILETQALTPFAVIYCLLFETKIMNSELGRLALSATLISDLFGTGITTLLVIIRTALATGWMAGSVIVQALGMTLFFILTIVFMGRSFSSWIIKRTPEGRPVKETYVILISGLCLLSSIVSNNLGLLYHFGPFIVGLTMRAGPPLGSTIVDKVDTFVSGFLLPLVATHCTLTFNAFEIYDIEFQATACVVFLGCVLLKAGTIVLPALLCKIPTRDSIALAIIMSSQGIVELWLYFTMFSHEAIDRETLSSVMLSILALSFITTPLLSLAYDPSRKYTGYQKRDILHIPKNSELRILACTQRKDDALAFLNLISSYNLTKDCQIGICALHLQELVGQASPLLINHGLGRRTGLNYSRSQEMVDVYRQFQLRHQGLTNMQVFTAISLPQFMQDDICSLAFDKLVSLIVLPFHKKWNHYGKVIINSDFIRTTNRNVLNMAPCSVGILVDRHKVRRAPSDCEVSSSYNVAMIYLNGNDDREALALAKHMSQSSEVHLTVIRLVAHDVQEEDKWEYMLTAEILKEVRLHSAKQSNVVFQENVVKDGSDTANVIQSAIDTFDLIIVGRHHRENLPQLAGLHEWIELPELGSVGDMLASADIDKPVSVLIVQQQLVRVE